MKSSGAILRVNLSLGKISKEPLQERMKRDFIGGRGINSRILFSETSVSTKPLSPENKLIFATGPLTGIGLPNSGKLVIASKSPLTGGYGDGNSGSWAAVEIRKAGYDALVIEGKASAPTILHVKDGTWKFLDADRTRL